ncbi:MAG: ATP-binding protein [Myxococcaceae bacterium]|nr:ATP-binding protein [Myxococcaceae bacterium]
MAPPPDAYAAFALLPIPVLVEREGHVVLANGALAALLELPEGTSLVGAPVGELKAHFLSRGVHGWAQGHHDGPDDARRDEEPFWFHLRRTDGSLRALVSLRVQGPGPGEVTSVFHEAHGEADAARLSHALSEAAAHMLRLREEQAVLECAAEAVHQEGLHTVVLRLEGEHLSYAAFRQSSAWVHANEAFFGRPIGEVRLPRAAFPHMEALLESRRALFEQDMHAMTEGTMGKEARASLDAAHAPPERGVTAPIFVEDAPFGFLSVQGQGLTPSAAATLELFARGVGAALENVRHHRRAREQLETLERLQGELVQRARMAVLGEAAAVVAHEVRNPLAVILNAVTLLRRDSALGALSTQMVQTVDEEARRLDALVRDLLQVTRPMEPRRSRVDLGALVMRTLTQLPEAAGVVAEVAQDVPAVEVDAHLLHLALEHLLRNAVVASGGSEPVRVRVAPHPDGVSLAVEDRGPGIPHHNRDRIFEPFFTTRAEGSGLGLTLVKCVADAHGARVLVEDREGGGARFILLVPSA